MFALGGQDDLALIVRRVEALDAFLKTDDGTNLLAGVKRAANILAIEEKKDKTSYAAPYDLKLLTEKEETALAAAIEAVKQDTVAAINVENFAGAMRALSELRAPVDSSSRKFSSTPTILKFARTACAFCRKSAPRRSPLPTSQKSAAE